MAAPGWSSWRDAARTRLLARLATRQRGIGRYRFDRTSNLGRSFTIGRSRAALLTRGGGGDGDGGGGDGGDGGGVLAALVIVEDDADGP